MPSLLSCTFCPQAIAQQPYFAGGELDAVSGPGAASRATALAMGDDLGPAARAFAVNTLGRMAGMGVTKAWAIAREYPSLGALMQGYQAAADSAAATAASAAPVCVRVAHRAKSILAGACVCVWGGGGCCGVADACCSIHGNGKSLCRPVLCAG
jgi:hypothetical protein